VIDSIFLIYRRQWISSPLIPPAATGTLSITYKGSLFADNEEPLLILIVAPSPGEPPPFANQLLFESFDLQKLLVLY
jgi:hypothetical protein